jgi:hypothetical protein
MLGSTITRAGRRAQGGGAGLVATFAKIRPKGQLPQGLEYCICGVHPLGRGGLELGGARQVGALATADERRQHGKRAVYLSLGPQACYSSLRESVP